MSQPQVNPLTARRAMVAASAGNIVEWYDWSVYATFAFYFSRQFFPGGTASTALISTFAVFAVGFIARPLGSVTLGRITDRAGRKTSLAISVTIVAMASVLIGVAPTAATIGTWAAVWLVAMRLAQGIALGAETSAAVSFMTESAPHGRRGVLVSLYSATVSLGTLLGAFFALILTSVLTEDQMRNFGWRIPFLLGGVLGLIALLVRRQAVETLQAEHAGIAHPVRTLWTQHRRLAIETVVLGAAVALPFFVTVTGFPAIVELLGANTSEAFGANILGLVVYGVLTLVFGALSDRIGRRPVLLTGSMASLALCIPGVALLWDPTDSWRVYLAQLLVVVPLSAMSATVSVSLMERYPPALRGSAYGLFWALSMAIFGGTGPMIATWLAQRSITFTMTPYFMIGFAGASVVALRMKETAFDPLRQ